MADGFHLWSQTHDRDMKDILSVQTEVTQQVVQVLQVKLGVEALDWLEKCYEQDGFCWGLKVYPGFDPVRTEPRFQALLKKVGLDK